MANLNVCNDEDWHIDADVFPGQIDDSKLKGITDVFGATCDYSNVDSSKDYHDDYSAGDVVGHLSCGDTWAQATCVKDRSKGLVDCEVILGGGPVYTEKLLKCTWA